MTDYRYSVVPHDEPGRIAALVNDLGMAIVDALSFTASQHRPFDVLDHAGRVIRTTA